MDQLSLGNKANAHPGRLIVRFEPVEKLFSEIDIYRALCIEPSLPWTRPVELVVPPVIGLDFFLDLLIRMNRKRGKDRLYIRFRESRVIFCGFGNSPEQWNAILYGIGGELIRGPGTLQPDYVLETIGVRIGQHAAKVEALPEALPV